MAKANLTLPDGTKVAIEGSAGEVAALLGRLSDDSQGAVPAKERARRISANGKKRTRDKAAKSKPSGPTDYIREIIHDGYFKAKREIGAVRDKLEERGHIYPVTSLSGPLLRLVKNKELRRIKEGGVWKYVNA